MRARFYIFAAALPCLLSLSTALLAIPIWGVDVGPPSATPTVTPTITATFSISPTFSTSPTPSVTNSFTDSPTPSATITFSPTAPGTFTITPDFTSTPTVTPTATPGEGTYSIVFPVSNPSSALVSGVQQDGFDIDYTSGPTVWTTGLISVYFPLGLEMPSTSTFYVANADAGFVSQYGFNPFTRQAFIALNNFPANSLLVIHYGQNQGGVRINSTNSAESLVIAANPQSAVSGAGVLLVQPLIPVFTATNTPIVTSTPTFTATPTFTNTQSFTNTPSITPTWTESPVAAEESGVFSYPNPFDMTRFDKCTFRFPADNDAKITVFNLLGEPIRELPSADINGASGWAIWRGQDDYFHRVPGGLYYVRIRGKNTLVRKFTVLN